jgi:hypothetical protein
MRGKSKRPCLFLPKQARLTVDVVLSDILAWLKQHG